jgi:hypothetical protein
MKLYQGPFNERDHIQLCADAITPGTHENYALVTDSDGTWCWYRRDYPSIRTLVELGFNGGFDYETRER